MLIQGEVPLVGPETTDDTALLDDDSPQLPDGIMTRRSLISIVIFAVLLAPGCATPIDVEAEQQVLLQADRAWAAAVQRGDRERVATYWSDDAAIYFAGRAPVIGKPAILEFVKQSRAQPGFSISWTPTKAVVSKAGDLGYTLGPFEVTVPTSPGKLTAIKGTYLSTWRKQEDGSWICTLEIHSPSERKP